MVNFRHFAISNSDNTDRIELNDFDGYLMTSPTGFGIYRTSEYITVGNQRVKTNNKPTFEKITCNVLILGARNEWESKYAVLRDFISKYIDGGFRLYYTPQDETRYIKCDITIVDKTEKDRGYLPIKLEIQPLSLWLKDVNKQSMRQSVDSSNLFIFAEHESDYVAIFEENEEVEDEYERQVYSITFASGTGDIAYLVNSGVVDTPLLIKIYGKVVNPYVKLKKYSTGEVVQFVNFPNLTIDDGYYLEINSDASNTYIEQVNMQTGERFDIESYANIESNVYITLPKGTWILEVTDEGTDNICHTESYYAMQFYGG